VKADVAIVGLGAGGSIAAAVLAEAGLRVVALEAGPRRRGDEMTQDEIRNEVDAWLCEPKSAGEVPTFRSGPDEVAGPCPHPTRMVNAVGGAAVHYPGTSPRFLPWNFRARTRTRERYGESALPAGSTLVDWPLGYDELEPHYDAVEHAIGISGAGGVNPFEGARARDYPMPPLRRSGLTRLMSDAAERLGWHPYPAPTAINSEPYNGNPACTFCGFCENNGCHNGAKGSPDNNVVPLAEATGNLEVITSARVTRVELDSRGRVAGVRYVAGGREQVLAADFVVLASHTYENVRLMLLSGLDAQGQVGRGFMTHVNPEVYGVVPGVDLKLATGSWGQGVAVDDFNGDNFDHTGLGFLSGGMFTAAHELLKPIRLSRTAPPDRPRWGSEWKRWLAENGRSVAMTLAQLDMLPYEDNLLDLDPVARDANGLPRVRVTLRLHPAELRARAFLVEKLRAWLHSAGATETWEAPGSALELRTAYGGTRMGEDPRTSVVDPFGFAHRSPNVMVVGASTFPTAGGHNPTLTVQALAHRSAEHLTKIA
jgi:gluconate 2-dehydrogenase alpha chain